MIEQYLSQSNESVIVVKSKKFHIKTRPGPVTLVVSKIVALVVSFRSDMSNQRRCRPAGDIDDETRRQSAAHCREAAARRRPACCAHSRCSIVEQKSPRPESSTSAVLSSAAECWQSDTCSAGSARATPWTNHGMHHQGINRDRLASAREIGTRAYIPTLFSWKVNWGLVYFPEKFCKIFHIPRHIEFLDACMEY